MKSKPVSIFFLFMALLLYGYHSISQEIPEIIQEDIPAMSITRNQVFDGSSLWGYMNGGADIYLEYGFDKLRVEEFSGEGENIKLELFKMHDPLSAFGIYSIKTYKCKESEVLTSPDCLNAYQYQLLYGDYYFQIINESGSVKAGQFMKQIAEILLKRLEKYELFLPLKFLTDSLEFSLNEIKMIKGELGIQNNASSLANYLKGITEYQVYIAKTGHEGENRTYYEIIFSDSKMKGEFLKRADQKIKLIAEEKKNILFIFLK